MKIRHLGTKISILTMVIIVVIMAVTLYVVQTRTDDLFSELTQQQSRTANHVLAQTVTELQQSALTAAEMIAAVPDISSSIQAGDHETLVSVLKTLSSGLDLITLCDAEGTVLARTHSDKVGDSVINQQAISTALSTGKGIMTIEEGTVIGLSTRGSAAIRDSEGNIIGALTCGHDLSQPKYLDHLKEMYDCEATLFAGQTRMNTTLLDEQGNRVVGTDASDSVIQTVLEERRDYYGRLPLFGGTYEVYYSPLILHDKVVGMLFTGVNIDVSLAHQRSMNLWIILIAAIGILIACILIVLASSQMIGRPLKKVRAFAHKIEVGDIGIGSSEQAKIDVRSFDEVGSLARTLESTYASLRGYVQEISERMRDLSNGDLTRESDYEFQGDFVMIKDSLNHIVRTMARTMSEITNATQQVSLGARQIADESQALAQGSTQQAASVEQLSSSIALIASKTNENAEMAKKAAELSGTIKKNAEKGSVQMQHMTDAVREINEASNSISKVIKVIDDIAFQTNILALNAAVEAARAGQHGKGFAVVAEEVRNLAAKSADAAKDTGSLISNSMEKAQLGSRIAGETAASLAEIVEGINKSTSIVGEIARSSDEQSTAISQINTGIDQVSQVVQQNSATAEESAAASEGMSSQSKVLQELVGQFKIDGRAAVLPPPVPPREDTSFGKY